MRFVPALLLSVAVLSGCNREPGSTNITRGAVVVGCDNAVLPVMQREVARFKELYKEADVTLRPMEGRVAVASFANDSVRVIVTARPFNKEERDSLGAAKIQFDEYKVALSAVAVIAHKDNPLTKVRLSQLDSIFTGNLTTWPGRRKSYIEVVIGGLNSSVNEVFRAAVLHGKAFSPAATPIDTSEKLIAYVMRTPHAIGIVDVGWLKEVPGDLDVMSVGSPGWQPDSTQPPGQYYSHAQAYVFQLYYPVTTPVYMYSREISRDLALGFISFVSGPQGQQIILSSGLVPVTQPVRLVSLTSHQADH